MKLRRTLKVLFALFGIALFIHLIHLGGFTKVFNSTKQIGWGLVAIVGVGGCIFVVRSVAWRLTLGREYRGVSLWTLLRVYVVSESMGILYFGGPAVADTARVLMLGDAAPTDRVISSVVLDRGLYLIGAAVLLVATILLLPVVIHTGTEIPRLAYVVGTIYCAIMVALWIAMRKRVRLISRFLGLFSKLRAFPNWTERRRAEAARVEDAMFHFLNTDRPGFWAACALNLAAHGLAVIEVLVVLWLLGASRSLLTAVCIEGLTKIANISGTIVPGNVGVYEAGNMAIMKLLGFQASLGLILALARDFRRIVWVAVGLILFFFPGFVMSRYLPSHRRQ